MWPRHDALNEFYLDIGAHLVEKNGLLLNRYKVWDSLASSGLEIKAHILMIVITLLKLLI